MSGTLAITMAGLGSRFAKAGYDRPKYEVDALGRPLFDWSMLSLEAFRAAGWRFAFAVRGELGATDYIPTRLGALGIAEAEVATIEEMTDGQATTALLLARSAPQDAPFAIYNIDTFVAPRAMAPPSPQDCAGWIPCFPAPGDGWSFARLDARGDVVELREKRRISDHATVGLYWFDSARRYVEAYHAYYGVAGREEKGERYVAPLYNQLIADGATVRISQVRLDDVGMLGTPDQVDAFIADPPEAARRLALGYPP
ncbi:MAG: glycosyltransferase family 2 protein [Pseudomonadota bacterium]